MLFVRPAGDQVLGKQLMFARDRREMPRANDAFAPHQVAGEIGYGVEFARKKFERRLVKDMDKAAVGLHVADCKGFEAIGSGVGMVVTLERRVDRKIPGDSLRYSAQASEAPSATARDGPPPVGRGKRDGNRCLHASVEKYLVGGGRAKSGLRH